MKPITSHQYTPELLTSKDYFWNLKTTHELQAFYANSMPDQFEPLLSICQNNAKLFTLISTTIPTMDGWTTVPKACALAALTLVIKPEHAIEIGVWAGRSLLPIAMAMRSMGHGVIHGIDPYSAQESAKDEFGDNEKWWAAQDHQAIKAKFLAFVIRFGLMNHVRHIEKPSDRVKWEIPIPLLHIDGSHTDQAVRDAEHFGPLVPVGGIAVLDDLTWVGGGVLRAIDCLEEMGFVEVLRRTTDGENWNIMQRVK